MTACHRKENVMFVAKKVVSQIDTQKLNNRRQKSFGDKTRNFVKKMVNTTHFWSIMKGIQTITMTMKKVIIQTTMMDTLRNIIQIGKIGKAIRSEKEELPMLVHHLSAHYL